MDLHVLVVVSKFWYFSFEVPVVYFGTQAEGSQQTDIAFRVSQKLIPKWRGFTFTKGEKAITSLVERKKNEWNVRIYVIVFFQRLYWVLKSKCIERVKSCALGIVCMCAYYPCFVFVAELMCSLLLQYRWANFPVYHLILLAFLNRKTFFPLTIKESMMTHLPYE